MTMRRHLLTIALSLLCLSAMADDGQTVIIGGQTVEKTVNKITFDGDVITLHFKEGGTQDVDMGDMDVTIAFQLDPSAIGKVEVNAPKSNKIYNLRGQYMGTNLGMLPAGPYIVNGKKVIKK